MPLKGILNEFSINNCERQGDGLSATVLNIAIEGVIQASNTKETIIKWLDK